jgi:GAF domain-containing protein
MKMPTTEEQLAELIDDGIVMYLRTLCMTIEEGRDWAEAERNFRRMLCSRIASAIHQAVARGVE